jgi:membrane fusion protein (multidrug efflux system)
MESPPTGRTRSPLGGRTRLRQGGWWLLLLLLVLVAAGGYAYWRSHWGLVQTDNAQVAGYLAPVSAQVPGTVVRLDVRDDQYVRAGTPLLQLDPTDYRLALERARARFAAAQAQVRAAQAALAAQLQQTSASVEVARAAVRAAEPTLPQARETLVLRGQLNAEWIAKRQAQVEAAEATLHAAETSLRTAEDTLARDQRLLEERAVPPQVVDTDRAQVEAARSQVQSARDALADATALLDACKQSTLPEITAARADIGVRSGQIAQSRASVEKALAGHAVVEQRRRQLEAAEAQAAEAREAVRTAEVNLARTVVRAPADGWVTNRTVEVGQVVQPNQPLLSLTLARDQWVVANIKETELSRIRVGDPVRITVDKYPGYVFWGHVESLGTATGAVTSLLPPDNATGNFVKVVQLVPVRITFDRPPDPLHPLQVGISVEVSIDTRGHSR